MESPITGKLYKPLPKKVVQALMEHQCWLASGGKLGVRLGSREGTPDFEGYDLDGFDFSLAQLPLCSFADSSLRGSLFIKTELLWSSFDRCDATQTNFSGADLRQARFVEAKYPGACFTSANTDGIVWSSRDERFAAENMKSLFEAARAEIGQEAEDACIDDRQANLDAALEEWRRLKGGQKDGAEAPSSSPDLLIC